MKNEPQKNISSQKITIILLLSAFFIILVTAVKIAMRIQSGKNTPDSVSKKFIDHLLAGNREGMKKLSFSEIHRQIDEDSRIQEIIESKELRIDTSAYEELPDSRRYIYYLKGEGKSFAMGLILKNNRQGWMVSQLAIEKPAVLPDDVMLPQLDMLKTDKTHNCEEHEECR